MEIMGIDAKAPLGCDELSRNPVTHFQVSLPPSERCQDDKLYFPYIN